MDAYTSLLLRSQRVLASQGVQIDLVMEIAATNPATNQPTAFRTIMDERVTSVEYNIQNGEARVGDVFFCGSRPDGKLVAYRFVPRMVELLVEQPQKAAPETAPGIDVDAPPADKAGSRTL